MVIRCERCSTLYDLDESLLSPSGSQVQCTRCQHLFTAYPPGSAGRTLVGVPAQAAGPAPSAPSAPAAPAAPALPKARSGAGAAARPAPASASPAKPEPKPVRTVPPPVYRPAAPAPGAAPTSGATRGPMLRRDTVGAFEARLRRSARMRWIAPSLAAAVVVVLVGAWLLLSRRGEGAGTRARAEALALAALDDTASLEQAVARLEEVERRSPGAGAATAERALVQVLRAGALADEGEALAARLKASVAERDRLRREQPAGWEDAERAAATEAQGLEAQVRAREERSRTLAAAALQSLRRLQAEAGDTPEVTRGLAAYHAFAGARDPVQAALGKAGGAPQDPWLALASAWLDARDPDRAAHERALTSLRALAGSHPEILRGRLLLAKTQAGLGRRAEAVATLDGVLAANGRHEAARRLRDELSAPVAAPPAAPPAAVAAGKAATQPRKISSQPSPPESPPPPDPGDSSGSVPAGSAPLAPAGVPAQLVPAAASRTPPAAAPRSPTEAGSGGGGPGGETGATEPRPARPAPKGDPEPLPPLNGG